MVIRYIALVTFLFSVIAGWSQKPHTHCGAQLVQQQLRSKNAQFDEAFFSATQDARTKIKRSTEVCTVQVVVHILQDPTSPPISNVQVQQEIGRLNLGMNHQNPDTDDIRPVFDGITGEPANIWFTLANTDPEGNPSNGIVRVDTEVEGFGAISEILAEAAKVTAFGGSDPWDVSRYLNIWVCNTADASGAPIVAGYATPPGGLPNWPPFDPSELVDGVLIQSEFFGSISTQAQKVVLHEVGHYFGLRHIWGDDFDCFGDDGIDDTPSMSDNSAFECPVQNTCVDNILGQDLPDMFENYMDYSFPDCQVSFTNEQASFMRWVAENSRVELCSGLTTSTLAPVKPQIQLFPNPTKGLLNIQSDEFIEYRLFDASGRICEQGLGVSPQIDLRNYSPGIYFVQCKYQSKIDLQRVVYIP